MNVVAKESGAIVSQLLSFGNFVDNYIKIRAGSNPESYYYSMFCSSDLAARGTKVKAPSSDDFVKKNTSLRNANGKEYYDGFP